MLDIGGLDNKVAAAEIKTVSKDLQKIASKMMTLDLIALGKEERKRKLTMSRNIFREFKMEATKDLKIKEQEYEARKSKNSAKLTVKLENDKTIREKELWRGLLIGVSQMVRNEPSCLNGFLCSLLLIFC